MACWGRWSWELCGAAGGKSEGIPDGCGQLAESVDQQCNEFSAVGLGIERD